LALLVLLPWWVVHMHECISNSQSAYYGVYVGMGQRRSHVKQLLIYIQKLVNKLPIRDRLIYSQQLIAHCHTFIDTLLHWPATLPKTLELNP
jgi:hypothetical protein